MKFIIISFRICLFCRKKMEIGKLEQLPCSGIFWLQCFILLHCQDSSTLAISDSFWIITDIQHQLSCHVYEVVLLLATNFVALLLSPITTTNCHIVSDGSLILPYCCCIINSVNCPRAATLILGLVIIFHYLSNPIALYYRSHVQTLIMWIHCKVLVFSFVSVSDGEIKIVGLSVALSIRIAFNNLWNYTKRTCRRRIQSLSSTQ